MRYVDGRVKTRLYLTRKEVYQRGKTLNKVPVPKLGQGANQSFVEPTSSCESALEARVLSSSLLSSSYHLYLLNLRNYLLYRTPVNYWGGADFAGQEYLDTEMLR